MSAKNGAANLNDGIGSANDTVTRTLVQNDYGTVLYDFRHHPATCAALG